MPKLTDAQLDHVYSRFAKSEEGQNILADLVKTFAGRKRCGYFNSPDKTFFNLGQQDVVFYIEDRIEKGSKIKKEE